MTTPAARATTDFFADDTSGWASLYDPRQPNYRRAATFDRAARREGGKAFTTNYVLAELAALLTSPLRLPRPVVVALLDDLRRSPVVEIIHVDPALDEAAWQRFRRYQDKE